MEPPVDQERDEQRELERVQREQHFLTRRNGGDAVRIAHMEGDFGVVIFRHDSKRFLGESKTYFIAREIPHIPLNYHGIPRFKFLPEPIYKNESKC